MNMIRNMKPVTFQFREIRNKMEFVFFFLFDLILNIQLNISNSQKLEFYTLSVYIQFFKFPIWDNSRLF